MLPANPVRMVREAAAPVLAELAAVLDDVADALERRNRDAVQAALERGRGIDELAEDLDEALTVGRETARLALPRRGSLGTVDVYADAAAQIDLAVRNVRVLARGARRAIDLDDNVPPEIASALRSLADAVRALGDAIDDPGRAGAVREPAVRAAVEATLVLERTGNLSVSVIVGQIRSTAVDLLRGSGLSYDEAADAVRSAVRAADAGGRVGEGAGLAAAGRRAKTSRSSPARERGRGIDVLRPMGRIDVERCRATPARSRRFAASIPLPSMPQLTVHQRQPHTRTPSRTQANTAHPGWHAGHQYVVRPPTTPRAIAPPQRGQSPPSRRSSITEPVCTPPSRIADRTAARSSRRSRSSSSSDSSPATRCGESRARQRPSSASRLPIPAIAPWSSSRALSGTVPRPTRLRNVSRPTSAASGPTWEKSGSSTARPSRRLSCSARRPPSANAIANRSQPFGAGGASISIRPDMPRCRPSTGPVDSTQRNLPRRCARSSRCPARAASISPGACGRQT